MNRFILTSPFVKGDFFISNSLICTPDRQPIYCCKRFRKLYILERLFRRAGKTSAPGNPAPSLPRRSCTCTLFSWRHLLPFLIIFNGLVQGICSQVGAVHLIGGQAA